MHKYADHQALLRDVWNGFFNFGSVWFFTNLDGSVQNSVGNHQKNSVFGSVFT
jgi:hypothetical protein